MRKVTFVTVISIIAVMLSGLFLSVYAIPRLREIFAPHPWSLYPPPAAYEVIDIYFNETDWEARGAYWYTGTVQARKFEVRIDSFSEELTLIRGDEVIIAPYSYEEIYGKFEGCPCGFGFQIIAPNKPREYEVNLCFIVSNGWLSIREYPQKIRVRVVPTPYKPKPEEILTVILDKQTYKQGEVMTITIRNISNETIWFTDTAYNIVFERFDNVFNDWTFHTAPIAGLLMTPLHPGEEAQLMWLLDDKTGHLFPPGRYRVGTHEVYTEFEVMDV